MKKLNFIFLLLILGMSKSASSQCTPFNTVNQPVSQPVLDPIISKKFVKVDFNEGSAIVVTGKYQIHQGYVSRIQYSLNDLIPNINGQYDKIILNDFKGNFSSRAQARFTVQQSSGVASDCHFQEYLYGSEKILEENICANGTKRFGVHNEVSTPFISKVFIPQFNTSQQNFIYDTKITIEFHNELSKFGYPVASLTKQSPSNPCAGFPEVLGTFSCSFFVYKAETACTVPEGNIIGGRDKQVAQGYTIDVRKWFDTKTSEIASLYYTKPDGTNDYLVYPNGANSTAPSFPFLFDKVGEYTFSIKLRKNGRICQLPTIRVKVSDCKKCLVDMTNGEANAQFICFNRELRDFGGDIRFLNLKYKCNAPLPDFWEVRTITSNNGVLDPPTTQATNPKLTFHPDRLSPACNKWGKLSISTNVGAVKYLMPKSQGLSKGMDYVIRFGGGTYQADSDPQDVEWRVISSVDPGTTPNPLFTPTTMNVQYRKQKWIVLPSTTSIPTVSNVPQGEWITAYTESIGSNMAKMPGSPTAFGVTPPTHMFYTQPLLTQVYGPFANPWLNGVSNSFLGWTETSNLGLAQQVACRTIVRPLQENTNELYRIRICNPCNIGALQATVEADFNVTVSANAQANTRIIGKSFASGEAGAQVNITMKTNSPFLFLCNNVPIASAVKVSELQGGCLSSNSTERSINNEIKNDEFPMDVLTEEQIKNLMLERYKKGNSISTSIKIFLAPNPVENILTVEFHNEKAGTFPYTVTDVSGAVILKGTFNCGEGICRQTINTSNLKAGMYILNVISYNNITTRKFIKL